MTMAPITNPTAGARRARSAATAESIDAPHDETDIPNMEPLNHE